MRIFDADFADRLTMESDQVWLMRMLDEIEQHLPRMLVDHPQRTEFWEWFCGELESLLLFVTSEEERLYSRDRVNAMLEDAGVPDRFELKPLSSDPACATPGLPLKRTTH